VNHAWSKSPSAETRVCEEGTDGEAARLAESPAVGSAWAVVSGCSSHGVRVLGVASVTRIGEARVETGADDPRALLAAAATTRRG
jgi:hypothetical protein